MRGKEKAFMNLSSSLSYIIPFYSTLSRGVMKPNRDSHSKPIAFDIAYVHRILKLWNPQAITPVASNMTLKILSDTGDYYLRSFFFRRT